MKTTPFTVEDVFDIPGRGTTVTGKLEEGTLSVGMTATINGKPTEITSLESFRKRMESVTAPANIGIMLRGLKKDEVSRGLMIEFSGEAQPVRPRPIEPKSFSGGFLSRLFGR